MHTCMQICMLELEHLNWMGPSKIIESRCRTSFRASQKLKQLLRALSKRLLNTDVQPTP